MEIKSRYAYMLVITDDEGLIAAYDYFITRKITLNNSAVYDYLTGIDLCCYNLEDIEEYHDFFDKLDDLQACNTRRTKILLDLNKSIKEFLEV